MNGIEFYTFDDELWCKKSDGTNIRVTEDSRDIVKAMFDTIVEFYPDAYSALLSRYNRSTANVPYFQFLVVNRFCRCNFGSLDTTKDDVSMNGFNFEKVCCPLRGECQFEGVICKPKFNNKLSAAEMRVMKLLYDGYSNERIAEELYLSLNTVKCHIKSSYCKLQLHDKASFVKYANDNKLFE